MVVTVSVISVATSWLLFIQLHQESAVDDEGRQRVRCSGYFGRFNCKMLSFGHVYHTSPRMFEINKRYL